jgi:hypothetical protein
MITIFVCAVLGIALLIYLDSDGFKRRCYHTVPLGVLGFVCGAVVGMILATLLSLAVPYKVSLSANYKLTALRTVDAVGSNFILGTGELQATATYRFMSINDNGSLTPGSVQADNLVQIVEDPALTKEGSLEIFERGCDRASILYLFAACSRPQTSAKIFRVPPGTVVHSFSAG